MYIVTVNGETVDYNQNGSYWAISVNGEYVIYRADAQSVHDGDRFDFIYEKGQ